MFIQRLEELMRIKNVTEYRLTQILSLSKSAIWNWKHGSQPSADKVVLLANYFEVTTDYLLGRSDDVGLVEVNADLAPDERELLQLYRKMTFQNKNQILGFAKGLLY